MIPQYRDLLMWGFADLVIREFGLLTNGYKISGSRCKSFTYCRQAWLLLILDAGELPNKPINPSTN
jgi:hypothetical protein